VLWIRIGFTADPIQLFISKNADSDPDRDQGAKPMRIHADPNPGQILKSQKV
jgi:hypothetical protein